MTDARDPLQLEAEVLVIGGGPAALWAAITAARAGVRTVLADKGFAGASGVAAAATAGHWWVPPDPQARAAAIAQREAVGQHLSDPDWAARTLEETWRRLPELADELAHPSPALALPNLPRGSRPVIEGPIYGRALRKRASRAGVRILDHSPALELLVDGDGAVRGAVGVRRQHDREWTVIAGAVVLATGGCSHRSGSLGSDVCTGDGYLMAAEAGAVLSGMEFGNYYGTVPQGASMDKNGFNGAATYRDADGTIVAEGWSGPLGAVGPDPFGESLLRALERGPVWAVLDRAPVEARPAMRAAMPNYFMVFDRLGIDPFTQPFRVEPMFEGTVRGSGGVRPADEGCWTGVPGLWAAGDTLSRERVIGATSGAGATNAAFTIASGTWAGEAAAEHGRGAGKPGPLRGLGLVGLRPHATAGRSDDWREVTATMQAQVLPAALNGLRTADRMRGAQRALDALWSDAAASLRGQGLRDRVRAREAAAMLATARWSYAGAQARTESRGIHVRDDFPARDDAQRRWITVSGTHALRVGSEPLTGTRLEAVAA